jgi:predicted site-specific integrase-resolvase
MDNGTIIVDEHKDNFKKTTIAIYARVSNNSRKKELEYQIERIVQFCTAKGYSVDKIYKEVASGMNDNRRGLWKMFNNDYSIIVVEHKDRLTRFGFNYIEKLLEKQGTKIEVINKDTEDEKDLLKDLVSIITSFCCRLYGMRRGLNKTKKLKQELMDDNI